MRRRPHRLQVSTFPFLAVLLCTMGSLILVLLVIDRRAKAGARAKALRAVQKVIQEEQQAAAARRAEWERRREALHTALTGEVAKTRKDTEAIQHKVSDTEAAIQAAAVELAALRRKIEGEQALLTKDEQTLGTQRATLGEQNKQTEAAQLQLRRLAADLLAMERVLNDLKVARERQNSCYSVVPYKGKYGDNRRPFYIECSDRGLVFHPDREKLEGSGLEPIEIRQVLERRLQRHFLVQAKADPHEQRPYLLMLLRPSGVTNYYRTLGALVGLPVDFGYELVDEDWTFDFPAEGDPAPQPWMTTRLPNVAAPPPGSQLPPSYRPAAGDLFTLQRPGTVGPGRAGGYPDGVPLLRRGAAGEGPAFDPFQPPQYAGGLRWPYGGGRGQRFGFGVGDPSMNAKVIAQGSNGAPGSGPPAAPGGIPGATGMRSGLPGGVVAEAGMAPHPGVAPGQSGLGPRGNGPGGTAPGLVQAGNHPPGPASPYSGRNGGVDGGTGEPSPYWPTPTPGSPFSAPGNSASPGGPPGIPGSPGSPGGGPSGLSGSPGSPGGGPAGIPGSPGSQGAPGSPPPGSQVSPGNPGPTGGTPGGAPGSPGGIPSDNPGAPGGLPASIPVANVNPRPAGGPSGPGPNLPGHPDGVRDNNLPPNSPPPDPDIGWVRPHSSGTPASAGAPGDSGPPDPFNRLHPPTVADRKAPPPPPRTGRVSAGRDWIIPIECTGEAIVIPAGGSLHITVAELERSDGAAHLQQVIRTMIDRRQATVRAGEVPYSAQVRFLLRPDGLRSYFLAFPALEPLKVPMTRANLAADKNSER